MLAIKPAGTGVTPPYNLAAATTAIMWVCALATVRVTVASTARGLELWSQMLRAPAGPPWGSAAAGSRSRADAPPASANAAEAAAAPAPGPAEPVPFASYRSSGGHAAAQVIKSS